MSNVNNAIYSLLEAAEDGVLNTDDIRQLHRFIAEQSLEIGYTLNQVVNNLTNFKGSKDADELYYNIENYNTRILYNGTNYLVFVNNVIYLIQKDNQPIEWDKNFTDTPAVVTVIKGSMQVQGSQYNEFLNENNFTYVGANDSILLVGAHSDGIILKIEDAEMKIHNQYRVDSSNYIALSNIKKVIKG